jgi:hypothetical protein
MLGDAEVPRFRQGRFKRTLEVDEDGSIRRNSVVANTTESLAFDRHWTKLPQSTARANAVTTEERFEYLLQNKYNKSSAKSSGAAGRVVKPFVPGANAPKMGVWAFREQSKPVVNYPPISKRNYFPQYLTERLTKVPDPELGSSNLSHQLHDQINPTSVVTPIKQRPNAGKWKLGTAHAARLVVQQGDLSVPEWKSWSKAVDRTSQAIDDFDDEINGQLHKAQLLPSFSEHLGRLHADTEELQNRLIDWQHNLDNEVHRFGNHRSFKQSTARYNKMKQILLQQHLKCAVQPSAALKQLCKPVALLSELSNGRTKWNEAPGSSSTFTLVDD